MKLKLAVAALLSVAISFAADIAGKWTGTVPGQDGQDMTLTFNFKTDGGKITGNVSSPMGDIPIAEGTIDGDKVSFTTEFNGSKIVHTGTVSGDEMKLAVQMEGNNFDMTLKRAGS